MSNDLISRDALKKDIDFQHICECCHDNGNTCDICPVAEIEKKIDDAPTIPLPDFKEGYKQAIIDGKTNFTKPEGKWIDHSEDYGYAECPFCEHLTTCEGDIDELHYCWHCGAKLEKGGAE